LVYADGTELDRASAARDEVQDQRDDCEKKKQVDEQTRALEHHEAANPSYNENDCEYQEHGQPCFLPSGISRQA
jgi:hypothetical protein